MTAEPPRRSAQNGLLIGRVRGVPVSVSPSWVVTALLLAAVYGPVLRAAVPSVGRPAAYGAAFGFAIVFGLCALAHEAGHTLVSLRLGYPVRRIVLFALGGVSEIEPEPERARDELLIAASGPLVSVLIAVGAGFAYDAAPSGRLSTALLGLLFWSNAALAVFNLLPGLPLDGGRVVRAVASGFGASRLTATRVAAWSGRLIAVALFVFGFAVDRGAAGIAGGLFTAAIAGYLWIAAGRAMTVAEIVDRVPSVSVAQLLRPGVLVPATMSIAEALQRAWQANARGVIVVDSADRPTGIMEEGRIAEIPPDRRPWTPVTAIARPLVAGTELRDDLAGDALLDRLRAAPSTEYLVVRADGTPAGVVSTRDFIRRLRGHR